MALKLLSFKRSTQPSFLQFDSGMQRLVKGNRYLLLCSISRSLSGVASGRDGYSEDHLLKEEGIDNDRCLDGFENSEANLSRPSSTTFQTADHKDSVGGEEPDEAVETGHGIKWISATQGIYRAILVGEAGYSPSQKILRNGSTVTLFSLGTSGMRNNRKPFENETPDEYARRSFVQWHRIAIYQFRLGALAMKSVKKGSQVYVEGNIETRVFLDPESNTIKRIQEIALRQDGRVIFLDENKQKLR